MNKFFLSIWHLFYFFPKKIWKKNCVKNYLDILNITISVHVVYTIVCMWTLCPI